MHVAYDHLILATGCACAVACRCRATTSRASSHCARWPTPTASGRCSRPGARIAIIGAGYIGLEVAASARILGADVVVIEREPRVLARVASIAAVGFLPAPSCGRAGVRIVLNADGGGIRRRRRPGRRGAPDGRHRRSVRRGAGRRRRGTERCAGARGRARLRQRHRRRSRRPHLGSRHPRDRRLHPAAAAAVSAAPAAWRACRMRWSRRSRPPPICAAAPPPAPEVPWFWSDQYDVRLQIAGLPFDVTETVVRGDPQTGSFAIFHLTRGRHRSGGRGGQRAGRVHGGTHDDRAAKAGGSGEAARRVMLDA